MTTPFGPLFAICIRSLFCFLIGMASHAQSSVRNLTVEYMDRPLGLDVVSPRFGWQMATDSTKRGQHQAAYQITVTDESDQVFWDSKKQNNDTSIGIGYEGKKLQPATRYSWVVTVWDQDGASASASSWFETGLLTADPHSAAWNGALWIGGKEEDMVLYSHYLSVFKLEYTLQLDQRSKSTRASFVFGANDRRLMDRNRNIQGVEVARDKGYIRFELDISRVDGTGNGLASLNVFRVGYAPGDAVNKPFRSYEIPIELIDEANKYDAHTFRMECNFGMFRVYLDGTGEEHSIAGNDVKSESPYDPKGFNLNPVGMGNNFISFPMVADIGFAVPPLHKAYFSQIAIRNFRPPSNMLFHENPDPGEAYNGIFAGEIERHGILTIQNNAFLLDGGNEGAMIVADPSRNAAPMLRTSFVTQGKKIHKARIYASARGIYELYFNGVRVGEDYFTPGLTQYNKTQMYQTYDITERLIANGKNVLGAWLGEGWWSGNITFSGENWNYFGDRQSLLAQLVITYEDGTEQVILTDDQSWKLFTEGPVRFGSFFQGEVYDAALEEDIRNWAMPDFDDGRWKSAVMVPLEGTAYMDENLTYEDQELIAQIGESPGIVKVLEAKSMEEVRPGVFVFDMGQNMVGFPQIELSGGGSAGDTITLRYSEVRYPDLPEYRENTGMIMLENIRAALTQDTYIRKGTEETIRPHFTFHGFRFLEITGLDEAPPLSDVKGLVVSSIHDLSSYYETSNELVNRLWENITWSLRGNFLSIPTDTPARNERMGWSGDINVFSEASTYLAQVAPFFNRHMRAMRDMQRNDGRFTDVAPVGGGFGGTLWGNAGIIVPWETYLQFGNLELLKAHYDAMKRYVQFLNSKIDPVTGRLEEGPLGDWLSPETNRNDNTLLWAAYHVHDLEILANAARLLGKTEDAADFQKQYTERKAYFNKTYVDATTHKTIQTGYAGFRFGPPVPEDQKPKPGDIMDTQASYAIPLNFGVFNEENKPYAIQFLVDAIKRRNTDDSGQVRPPYSLMTGFIGTASLNPALSQNGESGVAYRLLQQTSYPSWLYPVINGATTIWERLNSYTVEDGFGGNNSMNSFNHYSFGAVAAWMYNYSLGIQRDPRNPGFKHFILQPTPDPDKEMTWAKGYYDSMYGRIKSEWKWTADGWIYKTTIPANTTATLYLNPGTIQGITEGGKPLKMSPGILLKGSGEGKVGLELGSGTYSFNIGL